MFRLILFIFAISNVPVSQEETSFGVRQCELMILSDALPVQFWLSECDTYNEHEAGGVHHECWSAPWECDDPITVQFVNTAAQVYNLLIRKSSGLISSIIPFTETTSGVYQLTTTLGDENICDEKIQLVIASDVLSSQLLTNSEFTTNISGWTQTVIGSTWSHNATYATTTMGGGVFTTNIFRQAITLTESLYFFKSEVTVFGFSPLESDLTITFVVFDENGNETDTPLDVSFNTSSEIYTISGLYKGTISSIGVVVTRTSDVISHIIRVEYFRLYDFTASQIAKSDSLDIATTQDETIFMEYSNHRNFDGLVYDNASPDLTFGIRVPCRFFHEIEPEEDEAMELTSSIVTTSGQVKTQRLLEVKHSPYYFHKKLRRILKHQNITIFDKSWKKEEPYDVLEGNKRWPLKAATCYLTETNSVVRNVL